MIKISFLVGHHQPSSSRRPCTFDVTKRAGLRLRARTPVTTTWASSKFKIWFRPRASLSPSFGDK